jgi:predicted metal-dependent hydrolase
MTPVMLPEEFWQGVEQFNQQEFYACHDTLEALWIEAREPEKRFYQGILQIAVACYHLSNHNWRGAVILLGEGMGRLKDYQPSYESVDVTDLMAKSADLLLALQQYGPEKITDFVEQLECAEEASGDRLCHLPKIRRIQA